MATDSSEDDGGVLPSPEATHATALATSLLLDVIDPFAPAVEVALQRLHATAESAGLSYFQASEAAGVPLDPPLVGAIVSVVVRKFWLAGGAQQIIHVKDQLEVMNWDEAKDERAFVFDVVAALEPLAHLQLEHPFDPDELIADACKHIEFAANTVLQRGAPEIAIDALAMAYLLVDDLSSPLYLALAEQAAAMARAAGCAKRATSIAVDVARARYTLAKRGVGSWIPVMDAFEEVIRHLPDDEEAVRAGVEAVCAACRDSQLRALRGWLGMIMEGMPAELEREFGGLSKYLPVAFKGSAEQFFERMIQVLKLVQIIEDERLLVEAPVKPESDALVAAEWTTWSFRHHSFRAAIPHGDSFLRERDRHQLLLVMRHELTHLLCMTGAVGLAAMGLRAALFELELDLWLHKPGVAKTRLQEVFACGVAPLEGDDILALGQAEQALEILHKRRILEECWAPWFEGVAVFDELAGDPTLDERAHAPAFQVLANLVEVVVPATKDSTQVERTAAIQKAIADAEQDYAKAIQAHGQARLVTYLTRLGPAYLSGYLAVRGIVAAWRRTLGQPISGAEAGRVLVNLTQTQTEQAVPDLALPLDAFRREAMQRHLDWVHGLAAMPGDVLQRLIDRVIVKNEFEPDDGETVAQRVVTLAGRAYESLTGALGAPGRVPGASPVCRIVMGDVANALTRRRPVSPALVGALANHYVTCLLVLPLGELQVPFWLIESDHAVYVLLRTTEVHHKHGTPSYNGMYVGLAPAPFAALRDEAQRTGSTRMRVTRVADLMLGGLEEDRGFGRHALAMRLGSWSYVVALGMLPNSEVGESWRADIEGRTNPDAAATFDERWVAPGRAGAARTQRWLDTVSTWRFQGKDMELGLWAARVRALATDIVEDRPSGVRDQVARCLLALLIEDEALVDDVIRDGLQCLASDDTALVGQATRVLLATALRPNGAGSIVAWSMQWPRVFARDAAGQVDVVAMRANVP